MTKPSLFIALAASVSLHAAVFAFGEGSPWHSAGGPMGDAILISYVEPPAPAPSVRPAPNKEVYRKVKMAAETQPERFEKKPAARSGPSAETLARRKGMKPAPVSIPAAPKSAADFLSDPVKGRVFANYFGLVKRRIDATVRKRYSESEFERGTVSLSFVLNADGTLASAGVSEKQTKASPEVRDFALRCVRETAPFVAFPAELDVPRLAFNVTLLLDEF